MGSNKLLGKTLAALEFSLKNRDDFFLTTSFGYQSSLLFFLFAELGITPKCLFVKSELSSGGIDEQMEFLVNKYNINLRVVDRNEWLRRELNGLDFMDLPELQRKRICQELKRAPLLDFIRANSFKIWISGIRKDQSQTRENIEFMEVTDLNVIKLSPLYAWTKSEVRGLILNNKLRLNDEYFDKCKANEAMECGLHL